MHGVLYYFVLSYNILTQHHVPRDLNIAGIIDKLMIPVFNILVYAHADTWPRH